MLLVFFHSVDLKAVACHVWLKGCSSQFSGSPTEFSAWVGGADFQWYGANQIMGSAGMGSKHPGVVRLQALPAPGAAGPEICSTVTVLSTDYPSVSGTRGSGRCLEFSWGITVVLGILYFTLGVGKASVSKEPLIRSSPVGSHCYVTKAVMLKLAC